MEHKQKSNYTLASQDNLIKSKKVVKTTYVAPQYPALVITNNFNTEHITALMDAFQENSISYGLQTSKSKCQNFEGFKKDKLFIVVDDSQNNKIKLQGDFDNRKYERIEYPRKNNLKKVIKSFDKYIGLGKQHEQIWEQRGRKILDNNDLVINSGKPSNGNILRSKKSIKKIQLKSWRQSRGNSHSGIKLKAVSDMLSKKIKEKNVLFVYYQQDESEYYKKLVQKFEGCVNKRIFIITTIEEYQRYSYEKKEGDNTLLLGRQAASKPLQEFKNITNIYLYGQDQQQMVPILKKLRKSKNSLIEDNISFEEQQMLRILSNQGFNPEQQKVYVPPKRMKKCAKIEGKENQCHNQMQLCQHHKDAVSIASKSDPIKIQANKLDQSKQSLEDCINQMTQSQISNADENKRSESSSKRVRIRIEGKKQQKGNPSVDQGFILSTQKQPNSSVTCNQNNQVNQKKPQIQPSEVVSSNPSVNEQYFVKKVIFQSQSEEMPEFETVKRVEMSKIRQVQSVIKNKKKILTKQKNCFPEYQLWDSKISRVSDSNSKLQQTSKRKRFVTVSSEPKRQLSYKILKNLEPDFNQVTDSTHQKPLLTSRRLNLADYEKFYENGVTVYRPKINSLWKIYDHKRGYLSPNVDQLDQKSQYYFLQSSDQKQPYLSFMSQNQKTFSKKTELKSMHSNPNARTISHSCLKTANQNNQSAINQQKVNKRLFYDQPTKSFSILYLVSDTLEKQRINQISALADSSDTVQIFHRPEELNRFIEKGSNVFDEIVGISNTKISQPQQMKGEIIWIQMKVPGKLAGKGRIAVKQVSSIPSVIDQIRKNRNKLKTRESQLKPEQKTGKLQFYYKDFNERIQNFTQRMREVISNANFFKFFHTQDLPNKYGPTYKNIILFDEFELEKMMAYCSKHKLIKICIPKIKAPIIDSNKFSGQSIVWISEAEAENSNYIISRIKELLQQK